MSTNKTHGEKFSTPKAAAILHDPHAHNVEIVVGKMPEYPDAGSVFVIEAPFHRASLLASDKWLWRNNGRNPVGRDDVGNYVLFSNTGMHRIGNYTVQDDKKLPPETSEKFQRHVFEPHPNGPLRRVERILVQFTGETPEEAPVPHGNDKQAVKRPFAPTPKKNRELWKAKNDSPCKQVYLNFNEKQI